MFQSSHDPLLSWRFFLFIFEDDKLYGMSDWKITLNDQTDSVDNLRRESSGQYELDTFQPSGLNECDVTLF